MAPPTTRRTRLLYTLLIGLTALLFALSGTGKFAAAETWTENFIAWGYPGWFAFVIAMNQIIGALLVLHPASRWFGGGLLTAIMGGAVLTHLLNAEFLPALAPIALGALAATVTWRALPTPWRTRVVTPRRPAIAR